MYRGFFRGNIIMKMKKKCFTKRRTDYYLIYTLAFGAIALILYMHFFLNGKSLIWSHDGVPQHLNSLAYYGDYLREILHRLFIEHKLEIPMWDMHIGYGSDILTTLHYYVIGDPLTLLSVFVPAEKTEYLYAFLIFLRIYLAGIAFSRYCFYHKNSKQATLLGSLVYIFAGWTIYASMKHPYFANPMIYLPLILLGIDKIYRKEKPYVFIWSVALAGVSNFYFFYMLGIFMVLYAAFDYFVVFSEKKERSIRCIGKWLAVFAGYSVIAVLLAAVILLPVILPVFGTGRFQAENYVPVLYDRIYYEKYLTCLIGENMIQWGVAGYTAVAMTGVFVLFSKRKKNTALKWGFVLLNIFLLLPFAGHVLNGFSYVSNRWIWAYGMMIAYIFVKTYPEFPQLDRTEKRGVFLLLMIYCCLALYPEVARTERNMSAMILLVFSTAVILLYGSIFVRKRNLCMMISVLLTAGIVFNIYYQYSYEKNYLSEFTDRGMAMEKLEAGTDLAVLDTDDNSVFRYDQMDALSYDNSSMQMGTNNTAYYFSVASSSIGSFFDEMYLNTPWEQHYENLDGRTILDRLASVKYFVTKNGEYRYLPYGYYWLTGSAEKNGKIYEAFENKDALPLGYTYDAFISREKYDKMSVTEKQQALLQGIVAEECPLPEAEPEFLDQEIPYEIKKGKGCSLKDGKIKVTKEGAEMELLFDGLENSETYLIAEGLDYDGISPRETVSDKKWEKMSRYEKNKVIHEDSHWRYWKESQKASITVGGQFPDKTIRIFTDKYNAYSGKHDFLCNTGYGKNGKKSITLTFEKTGIYTFDDLRIVCQPMDKINEQTENLKKEVLTDVSIDTNRITGKITLSEPKALVLSLPYSKGFRAYVDGKETEILQANTMYMGLMLEEGAHEIELVYGTPFLIPGLCLTLTGALCYICLVFFRKSKKKVQKI